MGVAGMEQLISGMMAQTMLLPRYGHAGEGGEIEKPNKLSKRDLIKTKRPHIVYASSYNALHFRDTADRRNLKAKGISTSNKTEEEPDNVHLCTSPAPKRYPMAST